MITISNEQAKDLRNAFKCWQQDYDPVEDKEQYDMFGLGVVAMDELLALRKERERAEPTGVTAEHKRVIQLLLNVCGAAFELADDSCQQLVDGEDCHVVPDDSFQKLSVALDEIENTLPGEYEDTILQWGAIPRHALCGLLVEQSAPPAPVVVDDSLPFDPQIAEYEQMMEAEQAQADTTAQQLESLAFKSVVPEGWKLVPIELTKEMLKQIHPFAEATCLDCGNQVVAHCADNVTASWNDMLAVAPEPCK
ncbi:hypothetical protein [Cronobacter sakazakii]|uniref:hypothetical protein n=1 Tax=Cronobacter sakazakii TaxID=28141 RepID=UPI001788CC2D|nr:hypothetical protein [Cronobacter sakazakii]